MPNHHPPDLQPSSTPQGASPARKLWHAVGPGLVFVLSSTGPRDLVSNSIAGATAGAGLAWIVVLSILARIVILDASARYVLVTGDSLLGGVGKAGKGPAWLWFLATIFRRHAQSLVRVTLLGTAANFVFPLPDPYGVPFWGTLSWLGGFAVMYWGRYPAVERLSRLLALLLGSCLVAAVVLSRPDPARLLSEAFHPVMPMASGTFSATLVCISIISSSLGSLGNLSYSAFIHEKGWRSLRQLQVQRWDLVISMAGMMMMLLFIQIAAAGALRPHGLQVNKVEDLAPIFAQVLGHSGGIVLGVLLWGIVFSSHVTATTGNALMLTDVWTRFIRPSHDPLAAAVPLVNRPFYKFTVIYMCLSPLYVFATAWTPIGLVLAYGVISLMALPAITGMLLWLTADRRTMGEYVNGLFSNSVLLLTIAAALFLSWQSLLELIAGSGNSR